MDDPNPLGLKSTSKPETPPTKFILGKPERQPATMISDVRFKHRPEPEASSQVMGFLKFIAFILVVGAIGGGAYYQFIWLPRVPQEHDLTDSQGKPMHVLVTGHDDLLVQYTVAGSDKVLFLPIATLSSADQGFIAKLKSTRVARLPFACTLTDATGQETAVRVMAHNDNWAQYARISDGATHYVSLATLIPADQAVVRLLPAGVNFQFPTDYVFTGGPNSGTTVQLLGRNEDTLEYLDLTTGTKNFVTISELSASDQSLVRSFPPYMIDRPEVAKEPLPATNNFDPNSPIDPKMLKALVIIKGDYSAGSGFITKMHNLYFVVTNEHVLSGNKEFTITDMDGNKLPTNGPIYGATGYDVAILKIPDSLGKNYLQILDDPQTNAKTGDAVTVPGNSLGAGVPTQVNGELTAIGPELVEVSAQLVHGLSGSPIIDRPSGKVIGLATMSITYKFDTTNPGISTETRWFGYRVDNINPDKGWVKIDWARFRDEGVKVHAAVDLFMSLDALLRNKPTGEISNRLVQTAIMDFQTDMSEAINRSNKDDLQSALLTFNSKLRSLADSGTNGLNISTLYPYHAEIVKELEDLRKDMDLAFEDNNRAFGNIVSHLQLKTPTPPESRQQQLPPRRR